jgi:DNA-binding NtrC family response regulator
MNTRSASKLSRLLVVDDDAAIRRVVTDRLAALGYETASAKDGDEALAAIERFDPALVLLDLRMPGRDGFFVLEALQSRDKRPSVVVITAHGSIEAAVKAMRLGAQDFIAKPFEPAQLEHVVERTLEAARLRSRVARLESEITDRHALVGVESAAMRDVVAIVERAAQSQATLLLLGESGSGKEVLARHVHAKSSRAGGPFVAVNCATLSKELLESELFGHEKGAFTGAVKSKPGRIEQAEGGSLFLDEIGELDPAIQAKLLRVLQEREFERVGGTRTIGADVRVVCATHRDLGRAIREGRFREDLYYRINIVTVRVPPLRERREDTGPLLDHFVARHCREAGRAKLVISDETRRALLVYSWPGNVRELANVVERLVVLCQGDHAGLEDLPEEIRDQTSASTAGTAVPGVAVLPGDAPIPSFHDAVREAKRRILRDALDRADNVQTRAAKLLGLTQPYMARLMKNLDVRR